jgi:hypothetical protein
MDAGVPPAFFFLAGEQQILLPKNLQKILLFMLEGFTNTSRPIIILA